MSMLEARSGLEGIRVKLLIGVMLSMKEMYLWISAPVLHDGDTMVPQLQMQEIMGL